MRVAVVTAHFEDPSSEEDLITRRVAAALATRAETDVLLANGAAPGVSSSGALTIRRFPTKLVTQDRRKALWRASLGLGGEPLDVACTCASRAVSALAGKLPDYLKKELVHAEGGHSPELYEFIRKSSYDVYVFAGFKPASTCFGMAEVPAGRKAILLTLATRGPLLDSRSYDGAFARADGFLIVTNQERELLNAQIGPTDPRPVANIAFTLRTNRLAAETEPIGLNGQRFLVAAQDWDGSLAANSLLRLGAVLAADFLRRVRLVVCGRGWRAAPQARWLDVMTPFSRADVWRWMSRAVAFIDPHPQRVLGRDVLEALTYGTPVIVNENGGASREHAEAGNGGLWYETYSHLRSAVEALAGDSTRDRLGGQGREYTLANYSDPQAFIGRVTAGVLG